MDIPDPWPHFGAELRKWRKSHNLRLGDLARMIPIDDSVLSRWENGRRPVPSAQVRHLDSLLQAKGHLLRMHGMASEIAVFRRTVEKTAAATDEESMERRSAMRLMAALTAGATLPVDALERIRESLYTELGAGGADEMEQAAYEHACRLAQVPPAEVIDVLTPDLAEVQHALAHRPEADRAALSRVSAQMSATLAMALYEAGDTTTGRRWWRTSRRAADTSGDLDLRVWVRGRHAWVEPATHVALDMAAQAERLAGGRPSVGLLEAMSARALVAPSRPVREAIDAMEDIADRLPVEVTNERAAIWGWPEARRIGTRTGLPVLLGDGGGYDVITARIASRVGPGMERTRALDEMLRGLCLVNAGELEQGAEEAAAAFAGLSPGHRTTAVKSMAGRVYKALPDKARELPAARELHTLMT